MLCKTYLCGLDVLDPKLQQHDRDTCEQCIQDYTSGLHESGTLAYKLDKQRQSCST